MMMMTKPILNYKRKVFYSKLPVLIHTVCELKDQFCWDMMLCKIPEELIPYAHLHDLCACEQSKPVFT